MNGRRDWKWVSNDHRESPVLLVFTGDPQLLVSVIRWCTYQTEMRLNKLLVIIVTDIRLLCRYLSRCLCRCLINDIQNKYL